MAQVLRHLSKAKNLKISSTLGGLPSSFIVVGSKDSLCKDHITSQFPSGLKNVYTAVVNDLSPGSSATTHHVTESGSLIKVTVGALPAVGSRYNPPSRPHAISKVVSGAIGSSKGDVTVIIALDKADYAIPSAVAVARTLPSFNLKTFSTEIAASEKTGDVQLVLLSPPEDPITDSGLNLASLAAEAVRDACVIVDTPPEEMTTEAFHKIASEFVKEAQTQGLPVSIQAIVGEELKAKGMGGLYGVGKAATVAPRMVILSYKPSTASLKAALVGKGIMYDTGGLSIKISGNMCGMKVDCGGAAAIFGAFKAAVLSGEFSDYELHAVLCLAENAVGPLSVRNDDIIRLFSGKTVEINNTDAEGRLVLGDGVAYASQILKPDFMLDMATLTGAQLIATGQLHAGVMANKGDTEAAIVRSGLRSGDCVMPLLYCPEFLRSEFESKVADMKNSVKSRTNAQSSCAGTFIEDHIDENWKGSWVHCDIAGPAHHNDRGTGYGVALILDLLKNEKQGICKAQQ